MANTPLPVTLRFETGDGLDDVLVIQDDGSRIELQSKTSADLSANPTGPLGKTIAQLAKTMMDAKSAGTNVDMAKLRAVLAISSGAVRTLDILERACRAFDMGGTWASVKGDRSQAETEALDRFEEHARAACSSLTGPSPEDGDLVLMARLFRIVRFSMREGEDNWREASRILGGRIYGSEAAGEAPLRDLKAIVRGLIESGAPSDRGGLLRALRARGHNDVGAAGYDADLIRLAAATDAELNRLAGHTRLPIAGGIPVPRQSYGPLAAAVSGGSLIVVGEPGAGKTGALVAHAQVRRAAGDSVVFLSVDRFPGVAKAADLQSELGLDRPLTEVLAAAPGAGAKLLIIDALDAARGGPAEGVFAHLIETVASNREAPWTIAASIRTFDLRNGKRFRDVFAGTPPDPAFADPTLAKTRHFQVPRLSDADLERAGAEATELGSLLSAAPDKLRHLLRNVFNLSLAAQLLTDGASAESIRMVSTQSGLIDAYEDRRLLGTRLRRAAAATVGEMVRRRRLSVRKVVIANDHVDDVIATGVLSETGDLVSFSHHVLFDHVAGRFFLEWDDGASMIGQLGGDSSVALMLAPALRFGIERLWRDDADGKHAVWRFVADIYAYATVDPVLANVALRTAIEGVASRSDVSGLVQIVSARAGSDAVATMLSRLARFVSLTVDVSGGISREDAIPWAQVADAAIAAATRVLSDPTRFLLQMLFEKGDLSDPALLPLFGNASRALLALSWVADPPMQQTAVSAIRFVGKSYVSDPAASRALLERALRDPHFSAHADKEAPWIAEQILPIARSDPDFAIEVYRTLYSRDISDDSTSYFGGQPSRILPLSSNRSQDYRHCRYHLARRIPQLLDLSAGLGTRAVIEIALDNIDRDLPLGDQRRTVSIPGHASFDLLGNKFGYGSWDHSDRSRGSSDHDGLVQYVTFLRGCAPAAFAESIAAAASGYASPLVWRSLLAMGVERPEFADALWPYASNVTLLAHPDTVRDAVSCLAAAYPGRSAEERTLFEAEALRPKLFTGERVRRWWASVLGRFLGSVDEASLATDGMRERRASLAAAGELSGNPPLQSSMTSWRPTGGATRRLLESEGVDLDNGPDATMIAQSEALHRLVTETDAKSSVAELAGLWTQVQVTIAMYDAHAGVLHERVEQPVFGHVSNAVERIAASEAYRSVSPGLPSIEQLLAVLRRLWSSRFPEPRESTGSGLSWGNWAVRVYVAEAYVSLANRFGAEHHEIVEMFDAILSDPVPQVRLQAAQNLQVLSRVAPERMWCLSVSLVRDEPHIEVLGSFLNTALARMTWLDVERCEAVIALARSRRLSLTLGDDYGRDHVSAALGWLTAQLWVWQERPNALEWLIEWAADPISDGEILTSFLSTLRAAFFTRYATGKDHDPPLCDRAQRAAMLILESCSAAAAESYRAVMIGRVEGSELDAARRRYREAENVIHCLMNQIYFGSGAYSDSNEPALGLPNVEAMRLFLTDYRPMLLLLTESYEPATHHHLVELYEYLVPADPSGVFDALHALLTGAGTREGYHHESMANDVFVRIVTRYIADFRSIFEDDRRRAALVEVLRLFSDIGWPSALKLLYDLPELLR
ncbi:P-loop NTPase family protein [Rhizobium laguerreae]|uniref:ATP-binding protein n=1 Tax=Rhizobium laguerreae TaxID=1076926 RepID=UPI0021B0A43E|nr:ATP-binding protein [Rhizobium laguerreae]